MKVIRPGLLTSIQDLGRRQFQRYGVIVSGAMDPLALRVANILVGNGEGEAGLEITLKGPELEMQRPLLLAICGGDLSPTLDGYPVAMWRPFLAPKGSVLRFGKPRRGCRAYLAVAGGFDVPTVMGSRSTYIRAGLGGFKGRPLQDGDVLPVNKEANEEISETSVTEYATTPWYANIRRSSSSRRATQIRVIKGREYDFFTSASQKQFFQVPFKVTSQSDRMGYRLDGAKLDKSVNTELLSDAVNFGTIQVPSEGKPIILMADRQTTGGYPRIADVISVDLPTLAQAKPGDALHFVEVSIDEAQHLIFKQEREIKMLKQAIAWKRKGE